MTKSPEEVFPYEVAISLLAQDEAFADQLRNELTAHVRGEVFLYSRKQEAIAQDGELVELFKRVFRSEARVTVIVHRAGWGNSRYTAIEQDALRARYLSEGARHILVVSLDGTFPANWYPEDHYRINSNQFESAQIAAIIVSRLQEVGGRIGLEDPAAKAERLRNERATRYRLAAELEDLGPKRLEEEAKRLYAALAELAGRVTRPDERMDFDARNRSCRINYRWGSLVFQWHRQFENSMQGCELAMSILSEPTHFTGTRGGDPQIIVSATFDLKHPDEDSWTWASREGRLPQMPHHLGTDELAQWAVGVLLDITSSEEPPARRSTRLPPSQGSEWVNAWRR